MPWEFPGIVGPFLTRSRECRGVGEGGAALEAMDLGNDFIS